MSERKHWPEIYVTIRGSLGETADLVTSPKLGHVPCPNAVRCGGRVVYNGNYFCEFWTYPLPARPSAGECNWAMSHNDSTGDPIGTRDKLTWTAIQDRWEELHGERFE